MDEILNLIESVSEGFPTYSSTDGFLVLRYFRGVVSHPNAVHVSQYVSVESSSLIYHSLSVILVPYVDLLIG